ncbi:MAG: hypothetical protein L0Z50_40805 [Verrucomicrobiales bacterium]|nr:hypothetical protein [Verrucomicrobiales bacterium]
MDAKSKYLLELLRRMPETLPRRVGKSRAGPRRPKGPPADSTAVVALKQKLHAVRQQYLDASRRGDYLLEGRLKTQAAELDRAILKEKGLPLLLD